MLGAVFGLLQSFVLSGGFRAAAKFRAGRGFRHDTKLRADRDLRAAAKFRAGRDLSISTRSLLDRADKLSDVCGASTCDMGISRVYACLHV